MGFFVFFLRGKLLICISILCVFCLFLLLITVKEKAHKNVQYYLRCPQELTVALLGFEQFQFISIPGFEVFMTLALF